MLDLRFDGGHLAPPRRDLYETARDDMIESCGIHTTAELRFGSVRRVPVPPSPVPPEDVPYALLDPRECRFFALRIGLNAIGRAPENDIVLGEPCVSRRHCVVVIHSTGGCEIHDTASRNGTFVNGQRIERVWLLPGDLIRLCDWQFMFTGHINRDELVLAARAIMATGDEDATAETTLPDFVIGPTTRHTSQEAG